MTRESRSDGSRFPPNEYALIFLYMHIGHEVWDAPQIYHWDDLRMGVDLSFVWHC